MSIACIGIFTNYGEVRIMGRDILYLIKIDNTEEIE